MTPDEVTADRLRHFPALLSRWRGGRARFWSYTVSHTTLVIRVERTGVLGNLEVSCCPTHIVGPVEWFDADIEIDYETGVG